ncbi:type VI secretion system protein TssA [Sandaracinus amylolyticus]|uniref:ImpA N-terminal domain-containing protein n=1 Tax=Sandaracinus amylolyticus TaxID=927083 RepID=A0A0F6W6Q0_9BACT|nr:type VI secretion system protein TssA [Sandaracinus amylolyticus]AKF08823.1 Hypothetical protein DB32_005972 [Sandaracinus amylolyticus]
MSLESLTPTLEPWLRPIAGGAPAGPDPRALPSYQSLREEIAKLESPAAGPCRWDVVEREATSVLGASKDLAAAAYLAGALLQRRGVAGLALGTALLASLLERYDAFHPARPRARANALAWFLDRAEQQAAAVQVGASDRAHLVAVESALAALRRHAAERLGDDAPGTHRLAEAVQRWTMSLPPETPAPMIAPAPAAQPAITPPTPTPASAPVAPTVAPTAAAPSATDEPSRVPQFLVQVGSSLVSTAKSIRAASPNDLSALRLFFTGLHLPIAQAPAITKDRRTAMPAPPAAMRQEIERAPHDADPMRTIDLCVRALEKHRFWLDAHVPLQRALLARGARDVAELHAHEVRALVARLPGVLEIEFSDGTPFAAPATREWLDSLSGDAGPRAETKTAESPIDVTLRDAKETLRAGRTSDALGRAQHAVRLATTARERFVARLELAALALEAKAPAVALALSAELHRDAIARDLAEWDAPLAARACALYLRACAAGSEKNTLPFAPADVHARLCLLDPATAASLPRG